MTELVSSAQHNLSLSRHTYPDPFLDWASTVLPKDYQRLLNLCRVFAMTHPQVAPIVRKLAQYVLTYFIVRPRHASQADSFALSPADKQFWLELFNDQLDMMSLSEGVALDFMTYGCAYVSTTRPFQRLYICKGCGQSFDAKQKKVKYKILGKKLSATCPSCNEQHPFEAKDVPLNVAKEISVVRYAPQDVSMHRNPLTGKKRFELSPPAEIKRAVRETPIKRDIIDETPWIYIEAVLEQRKIMFPEGALIHVLEPAPSGGEFDAGMPKILPALKTVFLDQLYRKADESAALERTLPARFVYPQPTSGSPLQMISLAKLTRFLTVAIRRWRQDKNQIMTSPFPLGVTEIGNDAQNYNTAPMRQQLVREIVGSLGVPEGFLVDGMTWSGGSVQLQMLENSLAPLTRALQRIHDFVVTEVCAMTGKIPVRVSLKPFRLINDAQQMQVMSTLVDRMVISEEELLSRLDMDWDEQHAKVTREQLAKQRLQSRLGTLEVQTMLHSAPIQAQGQAVGEGATQLVQAVGKRNDQVGAHLVGAASFSQMKAEQDQADMQEAEQQQQSAQAQQQLAEQQQQASVQLNMARAQREQAEAGKYTEHASIYNDARAMRAQEAASQLVSSYVNQYAQLDAAGQLQLMTELEQRAPQLANQVTAEIVRRLNMNGLPSPEYGEEDEVSMTLARLRESSGGPDQLAGKIFMLEPAMRAAVIQLLLQVDPQMGTVVTKALVQNMRPVNRPAARPTPEAKPLNPVMPPR